MANSYRTEGIVLRTYKLAEADRIIVMLSPEHGQIRAVAKGVRRTNSKFGSTLEPFMHTRAQIIRGKSLDIVSQTQTIHPYGPMLSSNYEAFGAASAMVEIAERLTNVEDHLVSSTQFRLLHGALAALVRQLRPPRIVLDSYLLRALANAGWAPSFDTCARCGEIGPHQALNVGVGGVVCSGCRPPGSRFPDEQVIQLLGALLTGNWPVVDEADPVHQREASDFISEYLQYHVERSLHSLTVIKQESH